MKKVLLILLVAALVPVLACMKGNVSGESPEIRKSETGAIQWTNNLAEGLEAAREQGKPVMVDFYAEWCSWCKKLDRDVYTTQEVIKLSKEFVNVKVDTDQNPADAQRYKVQGLPTVLFLGPNGDVLEQFTGYRPPGDFVRVMQEVLKNVRPQ